MLYSVKKFMLFSRFNAAAIAACTAVTTGQIAFSLLSPIAQSPEVSGVLATFVAALASYGTFNVAKAGLEEIANREVRGCGGDEPPAP